MKALKLEYTLTQLTVGGGVMPDKEDSVSAIALYIEGKLFVERTNPDIFGYKQIERMYNFYLDNEADTEYNRLIEKFGDIVTLQEIEVPDSLLDWAKAVYFARNPSEDITALFS